MIGEFRYTLPLAKQFPLRPLRMVLGLSREELAVELGVCITTIARWERGRSFVNRSARKHLELLLRQRGVYCNKFTVDAALDRRKNTVGGTGLLN
jgi:ribosome-binding protein aMBF1 (putative translation factor)